MRIAWNGAFLHFNASGHALQTSEETLYTSTIMATLVILSTHTILQAGRLVAFGQLFSEAVRADQSVVQTQHPAPFSLAQVLTMLGHCHVKLLSEKINVFGWDYVASTYDIASTYNENFASALRDFDL